MDEEQNDSAPAKKSSGGLSTILVLVVAVITGVVIKTCVRNMLDDGSDSSSSSSSWSAPASVDQLTVHEIAGLSLKLPTKLGPQVIELPPAAKAVIKSLEAYEGNGGAIMLTHAVYKIPEISLDGAAAGSISEIKAMPGVSSLKSSIEPVVVDGLEGREVTMSFNKSGKSINHHIY